MKRTVIGTVRAQAGWVAVAAWAAVVAGSILKAEVVPLEMALPLAGASLSTFVVLHATARYGGWTTAAFLASAAVTSLLAENLSIVTGIPFGDFQPSAAMGPRIGYAAAAVAPMYFGLGYLAMLLAKVLLGVHGDLRGRWALLAMPVVGAFVIVPADLALDPFLATFLRRWSFPRGGGYFGVPLSNFLGWFVTAWVFLQIDALVLARRARPLPPMGRAWWLQAVILWGLMGLQQPLLLCAGPRLVSEDGGGRVWRSADLFEATTAVALFTMLFVAATACLLLVGPRGDARASPSAVD